MTAKPQFLHVSGQNAQKPFVDPFVYPFVAFDAESLSKQKAKRMAGTAAGNSMNTDVTAKT